MNIEINMLSIIFSTLMLIFFDSERFMPYVFLFLIVFLFLMYLRMISKNDKAKQENKKNHGKILKTKRKKHNNTKETNTIQDNAVINDTNNQNQIQEKITPICDSIHKKYSLREMLIASEVFNRKY